MIYIQAHVIESPPYAMLLGRPFDCITRSKVQNDLNGDQWLTLTDPWSKKQLTFPTFSRGEPRPLQAKSRQHPTDFEATEKGSAEQMVFQSSMI